jgi:O-antigen/teichoic acid export membrane protein
LTQLVQLVVWDRSDMIFLERLASSRAEISFFSVAFNLTDRALLLPTTLAHSTSVAMLVQYGRQPASLPPMAAQTIKYVLVMATPLLWGLASLSSILVPLLYGPAFTPAAVCLALSASIAVFRSLLPPGVNYLQAVERQRFLFVWNLVCAVVNVALDVLLIPRYQALGAVSANGVAQFMAIAGIWSMVFRTGRIPVPWKAVASILGAGAAMAAGVWALVRTLPPLLAVGVSIPAGAAIYLGILRLLGVFDQRDAERLRQIEQKLPARLRPLWSFAVQIAVVRRTADIGSIPGGENSR